MKNQRTQAVITLISCMLTMLLLGIIYLWSIFKDPVVNYFGWSQSGSAMVFSVMLPMNVCGIITGGFLNDKKGAKMVLLLGGTSAICGMLLTSIIPQRTPALIYVTYAIMVGFGAGLINNTCLSCVQKWWYHKRGVAVGLTNGAYALSSVVFAPLINAMLKSGLGVPGTFRVLALMMLALLLILGRNIKVPPEGWVKPVSPKKGKTNITGKQYQPKEVVRSPKYYLLICCMVCMTSGYLMINPMMKSFAIYKGLTEAMAVSCVMFSGIGSACARLAVGWISDRYSTSKIMYCIYTLLFCCMAALFVVDGWWYAVCIAGIAFTYGASSSLTSVLNVESFGSKYLSSNYGLMTVSVLISGIVSPSLGAALSPEGIPSAASLALPMVFAVVGLSCTIILTHINKKDLCNG